MNFGNLKYLIKKEERKFFYIVFFTIAISAILETISIAVFLPLFNIIFNNQLSDNYWIKFFDKLFDASSYDVTFILILIIFIFVFKNLIFLFLIYVRLRILNFYMEKKKQSLLNAYLEQEFSKFNTRQKSELMRNIYKEIDNFVENFLIPTIEMVYTSLILICVSYFLFVYDPKTTIIIFLLLIPIFVIFYLLTKKRLLLF